MLTAAPLRRHPSAGAPRTGRPRATRGPGGRRGPAAAARRTSAHLRQRKTDTTLRTKSARRASQIAHREVRITCAYMVGARWLCLRARAKSRSALFAVLLKYHTTTPAACGKKRALPSGLGNVGEEEGGGACHSACALRSREAGRRGEIRVSLGERREVPRDEAGPCGTRPQCCRAGAWGRAPRACGRASRPGPRGELGARTEAARGVLGPAAHARTMRRTT